MQVITVAKAKTLLGISDTSQDAAITAAIPFIDGVVKNITRNRWNTRILVNTISGSPYVELLAMYTDRAYWTRPGYTFSYPHGLRRFEGGYRLDDSAFEASEFVQDGQLIEATGVPADSYVEEIYEGGGALTLGGESVTPPILKLNANATADGEAVDAFLGIPIGYQPLIAKGVQWQINRTSSTLPDSGVSSKSLGPARVSYNDSHAKIDGMYGVPSWFVAGLPRYHGGH